MRRDFTPFISEQTDGQTHGWTFQLIERINPEGLSENLVVSTTKTRWGVGGGGLGQLLTS